MRRALAEDIGSGDFTALHTVPEHLAATGVFRAKQRLVLAGVELLPLIFPDIEILAKDGAQLSPGDEIARVHGEARFLLTHERVSLNFLQRLSGIATLTRRYVDAVAGTGVRILDTRKTTPGLRLLEKMATRAGGAVNHRMGLWDAVLIKNNHIDLAGSVRAAIEGGLKSGLTVECEVRSHAEVVEALDCGVERLLLDNYTPDQAAEEIRFIRDRCPGASVEISGGVTLDTVRAYADAAPDFISVGALTHSAQAVDINFRIARAESSAAAMMRLSGIPAHLMHWSDSVDSTMHEAARLANAGAPSGTVVGADEQTAGQGRQGRAWHSEKGAGLYVSLILRPQGIAVADVPLVTMALGLAAADAITATSGIACDLRWPNDILIQDKKCCGILTQLHGSAIVAGIGINVNHASFPPDLASIATSLRLESGGTRVPREKLLGALWHAAQSYLRILETDGKQAILRLFANASSYVRGRRVIVDDSLLGVTAGLDPNGFLILRKDDGTETTILAGGVRPAH